MLEFDWKQFKSGTDIRGVAVEGVPGQKYNLTDEAVRRMTAGFLLWLSKRLGKPANELKLAVGHDSRISADRIQKAVVDAMLAAGVHVLVCGLASTPSMFMITVDWDCDGSVQITASHHPYYRNGLKFFTKDGGLDGSDIEQILDFAAGNRAPAFGKGEAETVDYMKRYSEILRDKIKEGVKAEDYEHPLKGFHIVVDAGNGAGGFYVDKVLKPLGADTEGSQFLEPDGNFPNHIPNPEDKKAMHAISQRVKETGADFGIIFDTDVDRAGAVDRQGEEINRNRLIALISAILLQEKSGTIVTDSVTSDGLTAFIESRGGKHCRYKRGYRNVIDKAKELNAAGEYSPLAIETSGHAALMENYFLDDGAYLVTRILVSLAQLSKEGKDIGDLIADLPEPAEAAEVRLGFTTLGKQDFKNNGNAAIRELQLRVPDLPGMTLAAENFEGVRINFDKDHGDGWALVRMSLHEPIMPINFESNSKGGCCVIANELIALLAPYTGDIDLTNLQNYAGTSH